MALLIELCIKCLLAFIFDDIQKINSISMTGHNSRVADQKKALKIIFRTFHETY